MSSPLDRCRWCSKQKLWGEPCPHCEPPLRHQHMQHTDQCPACLRTGAECTCVKYAASPRYFVKRGAIPDEALTALAETKPGSVFLLDCIGHIVSIETADEPRTWDAVAGMVSEDV